jgi:predicted AAA+ superfamily ATPase
VPGFLAQAPDGTPVIDEIQRLPETTLAMKAAIDRDRRPGRFILTEFASPLRLRGLADSTADRVLRLPLYGFSQGELRDRPDDFVARVVTTDPSELVRYRTDSARQDYTEMIGRGAYPDAQRLPSPLQGRWLDSYLAGIVRRDLRELRRQVDPSRAESLLRALAGNQPGELVKARLATATSIPAATVTSDLDLLADVGLLATVRPWTPNLAKREVGRRKAYTIDSDLATRLARITTEQFVRFDHGEAFGSFFEGLVATELLRQQTSSGEEYELFHYRDRAGLRSISLPNSPAEGSSESRSRRRRPSTAGSSKAGGRSATDSATGSSPVSSSIPPPRATDTPSGSTAFPWTRSGRCEA